MKKIFTILLLFVAVLSAQELSAQSALAHSTEGATELKISKSLKASVNVFPNPAVNYIIVEINNDDEIVSPVFELFSLIGTSVKINAEPISTNQYKIPLEHINKGYYFVVVKDEVTRMKIAHKFLKN